MKVTIPVEVELNELPNGIFNATITVPVTGSHARVQPLFPFSINPLDEPGTDASVRVLTDIIQAALNRRTP